LIAALFGDYQYVDVVYWQLILVGAIPSNATKTQENNSLATDSKSATPRESSLGERGRDD